MHKKRSKRRQRIQLAFVYTLMTIAVLLTVAILILVLQGYRYNRIDGKLEQGGLVQFDSRPLGATVTVDDITLANRTASKITLTAGAHHITMTKEGYSTWRKDVMVKAGSILWLDYTLLFPNSPTIKTVVHFDTVASALPSPNAKQMASIAKADTPEITLVSLNDDTPVATKLVVPATAYTAPAEGVGQSFALSSWDKDNHLLIVKHTYGDVTEYISFDTRDSKARNISTELGLGITKVFYSLGDSNTLYALTTSHELRRINVSAATVTGPLATNVDDISMTEENVVVFTTQADAAGTRTVGYVSSGSTKAKTIATYKNDQGVALHAASGKYYGQHYTAVLHGQSLRILKGDLPSSDSNDTPSLMTLTTITVKDGGDYVGFSPTTNRMVYAAKGTSVVTYDLELASAATIPLKSPLQHDVAWLDPFHIFAIGESGYYIDYDGTNSQLFASNTLDLPAVLSDNEKYIYYFTSTENGSALQRVKLTTD